MQPGVIIMPKPAVKDFLQILSCVITLWAVEFFFIGLMTSFDLSIEARGTSRDEAVRGSEALAGGSKWVKFDGAIQGCFRASGIPVGEDGVIVSLNDTDGEGKRG